MYQNYKVLPIAPRVFQALVWVGATLGVISALIIFAGVAMTETPRWMGLVTLVVGVLYFFLFSVASEAVKLLLDINERIK